MFEKGKTINAIKNGASCLFSILINRPYIAGMPVSVGIELTNWCNLRCPECLSGSEMISRPRGFMEEELYKKIISEAGPYFYNINLYFQGEPMLHPQFFRLIENSGKTRITVSTNGHFLSEENSLKLVRSGISRLIVSLDGMDSETYSKYRVNGDLEKVLAGIRTVSAVLSKTRSSMKLEIQFLVNRYNESQINEAKKFAKEVNCSLRLKSMQVINPEKIEEWMPENEKYRRYSRNKNGEFTHKNLLKNSCFRLWMNPVVTWDGKVVPCCFDKDAYHIMGDLNETSFREIWYGEKFKAFRNTILQQRNSVEICRNCTEGLKGVSC
jgi:radical SAM protein with 4Fe4S-binding SPASM domain